MNENLLARFSELPEFLSGHMFLSLTALLIGTAISIPLGIASSRSRTLQGPALALASIIQTIPSLALLALMVPLLGKIGVIPALIALTMYSILPTLRNTVTGIAEVDKRLIEAARGMGMTENQILWKVQLPIAAPVIIAGIRTATVWVVGIATLSTPVGAKSLGNYIFMGLQTRNHTATIFGCVFAALLAIVLDQLIRLIEKSTSNRNKPLGIIAGLMLAGILVGSLSPQIISALRPSDDRTTIIVGSKTFSEQYILVNLIGRQLEANNFNVDARTNLGSTVLFDALANNTIDVYVDYSGTIWATIMNRTESGGREEVLNAVTAYLEEEHGILNMGSLGFENAYALAMRGDRAAELGIEEIGDLARHAPNMKIGGDYEFFGRTEWESVRDAYNLEFEELVGMDSTLMYQAVQAGEVDTITAFSTDGRITAFDLKVLDDPRNAFPPYDAILLLSPQAAQDPDLLETLEPLIGAIADEMMRQANKMVDLDKMSPEEVGGALFDELIGNKDTAFDAIAE